MKNCRFRPLLLAFVVALLLISCVGADAGQPIAKQPAGTDNLVVRAKQATLKHGLSTINIACLDFKVSKEKFAGKPLVDAREIHNDECGGDPQTAPRIFSIAFDDQTGAVWSDARSLVGQMEMVGME